VKILKRNTCRKWNTCMNLRLKSFFVLFFSNIFFVLFFYSKKNKNKKKCSISSAMRYTIMFSQRATSIQVPFQCLKSFFVLFFSNIFLFCFFTLKKNKKKMFYWVLLWDTIMFYEENDYKAQSWQLCFYKEWLVWILYFFSALVPSWT